MSGDQRRAGILWKENDLPGIGAYKRIKGASLSAPFICYGCPLWQPLLFFYLLMCYTNRKPQRMGRYRIIAKKTKSSARLWLQSKRCLFRHHLHPGQKENPKWHRRGRVSRPACPQKSYNEQNNRPHPFSKNSENGCGLTHCIRQR